MPRLSNPKDRRLPSDDSNGHHHHYLHSWFVQLDWIKSLPYKPTSVYLGQKRSRQVELVSTPSCHTHKTTQLTNFWKRQEQNTKTSRAIMAPCPINPETTTVVGFAAGIGLSPSLRLPSATPKERGQQVEHAAKKEGGEKEDAEEGKDKAMDHCGWTSRPVPHSVVFPKSCVRTRQKRRPRKRPRRRKRGKKRRANGHSQGQ